MSFQQSSLYVEPIEPSMSLRAYIIKQNPKLFRILTMSYKNSNYCIVVWMVKANSKILCAINLKWLSKVPIILLKLVISSPFQGLKMLKKIIELYMSKHPWRLAYTLMYIIQQKCSINLIFLLFILLSYIISFGKT